MLYTLFPLGNPGEKYAHTRHNVGRVVLAMITNDIEVLEGCEIFIPDTFMNESGRAVAEYFRYHEGRELVIIYDDKDLAYGKIRISHDRGDGGHNGVKSIIEALSTKEFVRIRVGIAHKDTDGKEIKAPHGEEVQGYVMGRIQEEEEVLLRTVAPQVLGAIKTIVGEGYQKAMERYN